MRRLLQCLYCGQAQRSAFYLHYLSKLSQQLPSCVLPVCCSHFTTEESEPHGKPMAGLVSKPRQPDSRACVSSPHSTTFILVAYSTGQNLKVTIQLCDYLLNAGPPAGGSESRQCIPITLLCTWTWHSNSHLEKPFSDYPHQGGRDNINVVTLVEEREGLD